MKKSILIVLSAVVSVVALYVTPLASATSTFSPSQIATQTRQVINQRLRFVHRTDLKVSTVRCQGQGVESWFCVVKLRDSYGSLTTYYYSVALVGANLKWTMQ